jgi:hypothetical protein
VKQKLQTLAIQNETNATQAQEHTGRAASERFRLSAIAERKYLIANRTEAERKNREQRERERQEEFAGAAERKEIPQRVQEQDDMRRAEMHKKRIEDVRQAKQNRELRERMAMRIETRQRIESIEKRLSEGRFLYVRGSMKFMDSVQLRAQHCLHARRPAKVTANDSSGFMNTSQNYQGEVGKLCEICYDDKGCPYYYNIHTQESTYEKPITMT